MKKKLNVTFSEILFLLRHSNNKGPHLPFNWVECMTALEWWETGEQSGVVFDGSGAN